MSDDEDEEEEDDDDDNDSGKKTGGSNSSITIKMVKEWTQRFKVSIRNQNYKNIVDLFVL